MMHAARLTSARVAAAPPLPLLALTLALVLLAGAGCLPTSPGRPETNWPDYPLDAGHGDTGSAKDAGGDVDAGVPDAAEAQDAGWEPPADGAIRVASYNTHRFFDTVCDTGQCGSGDYEEQPTLAEFNAKADLVAAAIRSLGVDAVCLQELETQASLDALTQRLPEFPVAHLAETGYAASVDVAVMAKGTLLETRSHYRETLTRPDGSRTSWSRDFLEMHLQQQGQRVIVFCGHFKSQSNDDPGRRLAEAQRARAILAASAVEHPEALIVMGGDLNDTPGSPPLDALLSGDELARAGAELPNDVVATYRWNGNLDALDHLLWDVHGSGGYVVSSARAARDAPNRGLGGSDHAAIVADFNLPR